MADKDDKQLENEARAAVRREEEAAQKASSKELKSINIIGKIIGIIVVAWLVSVSYYAFTFFVLGMLPAITAMMIDRGVGRFASKTVTACNFVGILPYLFEIAASYEASISAKDLMANPETWLFIYGFAAIGWILIWMLPQLTVIFFTVRADIKTDKLQREQASLLAEWGEEVKTGKRKVPRTKV